MDFNSDTVVSASSKGFVISLSISFGPAPSYLAVTTATGMFKSGSKSSFNFESETAPIKPIDRIIIIIAIGRRMATPGKLILNPPVIRLQDRYALKIAVPLLLNKDLFRDLSLSLPNHYHLYRCQQIV